MKVIDRFFRLLLVIMILLSIVLSAKIWTNSGKIDAEKEETTDSILQKKLPQEVFVPTQFVYHSEDGRHFYSNHENFITSLNKALVKLSVGKLKPVVEGQRDIYVDIQTKRESMELIFPNELNLAYYFEVNHLSLDRSVYKALAFNRIVLDFKENKLYFLADDQLKVYEASISGSTKELEHNLYEKENKFKEVTANKEWLPAIYSTKETDDMTFKKYSYILATQSYTIFSKAFFDKTEEIFPNESSKESKDVNLMNYEGESMTVSYQTGEVNFFGRIRESSRREALNLFSDSFYYLEDIASSFGTLRYFDSTDSTIVYRSYVEGYPVFSDYSRGSVQFNLMNQNVRILTNQETIQVPIPSDETITLPTTQEVITQLTQAGIPETDINNLKIGYTWRTNDETKQVVDLIPEWYLKYKNEWKSVANVLIEQGIDEGGQS